MKFTNIAIAFLLLCITGKVSCDFSSENDSIKEPEHKKKMAVDKALKLLLHKLIVSERMISLSLSDVYPA